MTTNTESYVTGPQGPMNTGTGHQFAGTGNTYIFDQSGLRLIRAGRDPRAIADDHLRWLNQRFIEPRHYGRAWELLTDTGSVLLTGAPGTGRRSTAQMLLYRLPGAQGQIRELPDASETTDSSDEPVLDGAEVDTGQRLLLDLSVAEEKSCRILLGQLPTFRAAVQARGAHLVVVLPRSRQHHLGAELGPSAIDIVRPDGREVFRRYLRSDGIQATDEQLAVDELPVQLHSGPMAHVAKLAELVLHARDAAPTQTLAYWLEVALEALTERSHEVAKQITAIRSGQQRALLLTTAMFSGVHADAAFEAATKLCEIVQHPVDERPRLERADLAERLAEIEAKTDDSGRVGFTLLAYDRAVRTHFWSNFPDLRSEFRKWVETAVGHRTLTSAERDEIVTRFAEQALRTGRPDDLTRMIEHFVRRTDPRWPSRLLPQAARVLDCGLNHERHGVFFRRQLYTWSRNPQLPHDLAQVVVQLCSEVLALTHPEQAMVRLHHIFRRHPSATGTAAHDALLDLANRDHHLYRFLLSRLTSDQRATEDIVPDLSLFLELAAPIRLTHSQRGKPPLITDVAIHDPLVSGWRAALSGPFSPHCASYVQSWLAACEDDRYCEKLLDILVTAGDGRNDVLSRLYVLARDWAFARDEHQAIRSRTAARLTSKIDLAQGLDFTDFDLGHHTEGARP